VKIFSRKKQTGAVLILIAFIIGLAAAAYLVQTFNIDKLKAEKEERTYKALNRAKQALIAWSASHPNLPGLMPYPDRNLDNNYDNTSDCYASNVNFAPHFTIGRLPLFNNDPNCINLKQTVQFGVAEDIYDADGDRLWYEVSKNLLHDYKNNGDPLGVSPIINPSIVNTPNNPWFIVRDRSGKILSDRVAVVIISAGAPNVNQDRSSGIANPNQYLDKVVMADGTVFQNYGYQDTATNPVQEFIIAEDKSLVAKNDPTYKNQVIEPYLYNDKIVYITVDELMSAVERRVAMQARTALNNYKTSKGYYPHAAKLGATNNYSCDVTSLNGFLPIQAKPANCSCSWGPTRECKCPFNDASEIKFSRSSGSFVNNVSGSCVRISSKVCSCSGQGSCNNSTGIPVFDCDANGSCKSTVNGSYTFSGTFNKVVAGCALPTVSPTGCLSTNSVSCSSAGNFLFEVCGDPPFNSILTNSVMPTWFEANKWQDYIYYDRNASLVVGTKTGVEALLITVGASQTGQTRPSCGITSYLDSLENTNEDLIFEKTTKPRTYSYNDQSITVSQ
jgi:hypothetical protein